jgi:hypothetical protein
MGAIPVFFVLFRMVAFSTVPIDDYTSPVLWLDCKLPYFEPWSPTCYRFGYLLSGYVWYKLIPLLPLSNFSQSPFDTATLRALQGVTLASFHYLLAFIVCVYYFVRKKLNTSGLEAFTVSVITGVLLLNMDFYGIDNFYLFLAMLLLININKLAVFAPLMLVSPLLIEKISLFFFIYFTLLIALERKYSQYSIHLLLSFIAFCLYFLIRMWLQFPGHEYQTDITQFPHRLALAFQSMINIKGIYMNLLPTALCLFFIHSSKKNLVLHPSLDWVGNYATLTTFVIALFILGCFVSSHRDIGRNTMHVLPFLVPYIFHFVRTNWNIESKFRLNDSGI